MHSHNILLTCTLTEIEVSNSVYCTVMAKFCETNEKKMGVPNFMEGSLISYEIGDPRVPKILGNWGPGSLTSYENGDRLLWPCKVAKRHADACAPTDLYQRVGGSSEPPEPPQRTDLGSDHKLDDGKAIGLGT